MTNDDEMLELFMHPGWKRFQAEMKEGLETMMLSCHACKDEKDFYKQKGMIQALSNVVNFELLFRTNLDMIDENEQPAWHMDA